MEKAALGGAFPRICADARGTAPSFGGSQMWFGEKTARERRLRCYGCGIVGMADTLLYLAARDPAFDTPLTHPLLALQPPTRAGYLAFADDLERRYTRVLDYLGLIGPQLSAALNAYFRDYRLPLRASWRMLPDFDRGLGGMTAMLRDDLPVVFSLPTIFLQANSMHLYRTVPFDDTARENAMLYHSVGGHFLTATAIEPSPDGHDRITASSWGRRYYVDLLEYRRHAASPAGLIACGYLALQRLPGPLRTPKITIRVGRPAAQAPAAPDAVSGAAGRAAR